VNWFRQAAKQDLPEAQYMLGQAFHEGVGTHVDYATALDWYVTSAVQGYAPAQLMAAMVYLSGDAGRIEAGKAHIWADVALTNGRTEASLVRDYASYKLSRREIEQAKEAAQRCLKSAYKDCPPR
jgi:TPR repeat protein